MTVIPSSLSNCRFLSSNRSVVTKVKRDVYAKTYDSVMVLPDGATIKVRYPTPRQIIRVSLSIPSFFACDNMVLQD